MADKKAAKTKAGENIPIQKLADELRPLLHRLTRNLRREAVEAGFSSMDLAVLGLVKRKPGIGVSELATIEGTTRASMSGHVARLLEAGWLDIDSENELDQRRSHLLITPAGDRALTRIRESSNRWLSRQIEGLSLAERRALSRAIPAMQGLLKVNKD